MSKRDVVELRKRIDAEQTRLDEHLTTEGELLSGAPLWLPGSSPLRSLLICRGGKKKPRALTITWKLR
jgi:hypothetical protein